MNLSPNYKAPAGTAMPAQGVNQRTEPNIMGFTPEIKDPQAPSEGFHEWFECDLAKSGISLEQAPRLGIQPAFRINIHDILGFKPGTETHPLEGYGIPFYDPETSKLLTYADESPFIRVRLRYPAIMDKNGAPEEAKYLSPSGSGTFPYILPEVHRFLMDHPDEPVIFTEGEKKAVRALNSGIHVIGLVGIWGWMAGKGDKSLHPMLLKYMRPHRPVVMAYDSDAVDPKKAESFDNCAHSMANALLEYKTHLKRVNLPEVAQ